MRVTINQTLRQSLLWRCVIAGLGGYYYAYLVALLIGVWRDAPRAEATISGIVIAFSVHLLIIIATFATTSLKSFVALLLGSAIFMALMIFIQGGFAFVRSF